MDGNSAIGSALIIPSQVLKDIQAVDEQIAKLAQTSKETQKEVNKAFEQMAQGVNPFEQKLRSVQQMLETIGSTAGQKLTAGLNEATRASGKMSEAMSAGVKGVDNTAKGTERLEQKMQSLGKTVASTAGTIANMSSASVMINVAARPKLSPNDISKRLSETRAEWKDTGGNTKRSLELASQVERLEARYKELQKGEGAYSEQVRKSTENQIKNYDSLRKKLYEVQEAKGMLDKTIKVNTGQGKDTQQAQQVAREMKAYIRELQTAMSQSKGTYGSTFATRMLINDADAARLKQRASAITKELEKADRDYTKAKEHEAATRQRNQKQEVDTYAVNVRRMLQAQNALRGMEKNLVDMQTKAQNRKLTVDVKDLDNAIYKVQRLQRQYASLAQSKEFLTNNKNVGRALSWQLDQGDMVGKAVRNARKHINDYDQTKATEKTSQKEADIVERNTKRITNALDVMQRKYMELAASAKKNETAGISNVFSGMDNAMAKVSAYIAKLDKLKNDVNSLKNNSKVSLALMDKSNVNSFASTAMKQSKDMRAQAKADDTAAAEQRKLIAANMDYHKKELDKLQRQYAVLQSVMEKTPKSGLAESTKQAAKALDEYIQKLSSIKADAFRSKTFKADLNNSTAAKIKLDARDATRDQRSINAQAKANAQAEEQLTRKVQEEAKKRVAAYREANAAQLRTPQGAMDFAKHAGTIQRQEQALKNLKAVYDTLPQSTKNFSNVQLQLKTEIDRVTESLQRAKAARDGAASASTKSVAKDLNLSQISEQLNNGVFRKSGSYFEEMIQRVRQQMLSLIKEGKGEQLNLLRQLEPALRSRMQSYANLTNGDGSIQRKYRKDFESTKAQLAILDDWQRRMADIKAQYGRLVVAANESFQKQAAAAQKVALKTQVKDDALNINNLNQQRVKAKSAEMSQYYKELEKEEKNRIANETRFNGELQRLASQRDQIEQALNKARPGVDTSNLQRSLENINGLQEKIRQAKGNIDSMGKSGYAKTTLYQSQSQQIRAAGQEELRAFKAANKAKEEELRRFQENYDKIRQQQLKTATMNRNSFDGAMSYSKNTKSLLQEKQAVEALKAARERLNPATEAGAQKIKQLNAEIARHNANIAKAVEGSNRLRSSHSNLLNISQQLGRQLALMFSVSQVESYIASIAKVRGEMELQQVSLRTILQNRTQADEIFNKTKALAVQSPFRVGQLVTYTKQLAAYRIESNKLFDTTKRLADVSAGLGVDMQRLILAYGQVKAAAYLRGTEVRQFTEAGVNMYGELQSYFKEVKGEAYTTAQIVDMISKRKVTFEDVAAVFKRLTDQGGLFYDMQRIQSETLYGKMEKLKDQIYLMKDAIGKDNEGVIKGTVDALAALLKNWQAILAVGKVMVPTLLAMTAAHRILTSSAIMNSAAYHVLRDNIALVFDKLKLGPLLGGMFTKVLAGTITAIGMMGKALLYVGKLALVSLPIAALSFALELWQKNRKAVADYNKALGDSMNKFYQAHIKIDEIKKKASSDVKEALDMLSKEMSDAGFEITISPEISTDEANEKYRKYLKDYEQFLIDMRAIDAKYASDKKEGSGIFSDSDAGTVFKTATEAQGKFLNEGDRLLTFLQKTKMTMKGLSDPERKEIENLIQTTRGAKDLGVAYEQLAEKLSKSDIGRKLGWKSGYTNNLTGFRSSFQELSHELDAAKEKARKFFGDFRKNLTDEEKNELKVRIHKKAVDEDWGAYIEDKLYKWYGIDVHVNEDTIVNEVNWVDEYIKDYFANKKYTVKISTGVDVGVTEKDISKALKAANDYISAGDDAQKNAKTMAEFGKRLLKGIGRRAKTVKVNQNIRDFFNGTLPETQIEVNVSDMVKLQQAYENLAKQKAAALGNPLEPKTKKGRDKDLDIWQARIDVLEKMQKRYEDLRQYMPKKQAMKKVKDDFADAIKEAQIPAEVINNLVPTKEGVAQALEVMVKKFRPKKATKKQLAAALSKIAELKIEIDKEKLQKDLDNAKRIIDKALNGIQLRKNFTDLGLKDFEVDNLTKALGFDRLETSYENIKKNMQKLYKIPEEFRGLSGKQLLDIDVKDKAVREKLKDETGVKYFEQYRDSMLSMDEKLYDERMKNIQELTKTYKTELDKQLGLDVAYMRAQEKIRENIKDPEKQKEYLEAAKKRYEENKSKQAWEDFQNSDLYVTAFRSVENASTSILSVLYNKLFSFRKEMGKLPPEIVKQVTKAMEDIEKTVAERHPFSDVLGNPVFNSWTDADDKQLAKLKKELKDSAFRIKESEKDYKHIDKKIKDNTDENGKLKEDASLSPDGLAKALSLRKKIAAVLENEKASYEDIEYNIGKMTDNSFSYLDYLKNRNKWTEKYIYYQEKLANLREQRRDSQERLENNKNEYNALDKRIKDNTDENTGKLKSDSSMTQAELEAALALRLQIYETMSNEKVTLEGINESITAATEKSNFYADILYKGAQAGDMLNKKLTKIQELTKKAGDIAEKFTAVFDKKAARRIGKAVTALDTLLESMKTINTATKSLGEKTQKAMTKVTEKTEKAMDDVYEVSSKAIDKTVEAGEAAAKGMEATVDGVSQGVKATSVATAASLKTIESASAILAIISAVIQVAMAVAAMFNDDDEIQADIEDMQEKVTDLQWRYEKLKKSMDDAWSIDKLVTYHDQMERNLRMQAASYRAMAQAERDKKDTDQNKVNEYLRQASDIEDQIKELAENLTEELGGFGTDANFKSAAQSFADAWVDAFNEGSNALDALKEQSNEYFDNLIKKQLMNKLTERILMPQLKKLDKMVSEGSAGNKNGLEITRSEVQTWKEGMEETLKQYNEEAKAWMDMLGLGPNKASLSALQQGITNITEEQAAALESLLNSMRFFLANQSADVHSILGAIREQSGMVTEENPMLTELKAQTGYLRNLSDKIDSVFVRGVTKGGGGLQVYVANL